MRNAEPDLRRLVLVTGPAGAGRSAALRVLEDAGFEAIDNLPLGLIPQVLDSPQPAPPLALVIDPRNRDFSPDAVLHLARDLKRRDDMQVDLLYLDCATDVLLRRYSETRRRHPAAPRERLAEGIELEQAALAPIRAEADVLIDTGALNVHQLRDEVFRWFGPEDRQHLAISVQSFSYKRGLPRAADMVFDCRFLRNPHWSPDLRALTGLDASVAAHVKADPRYSPFAEQVGGLTTGLLPAFRDEGKSYLSLAFGCTGGRHRSVTVAEDHALRLADAGWQVSIRHRELERQHHQEAHG